MRRLLLVGFVLLAALSGAASATAAPNDPLQFKYSFDGSGVPGGIGFVGQIKVEAASGNLLVLDTAQGVIDQFDPEGNPVNFTALGSPQIALPTGGGEVLMVDNSGGPNAGNIYVFGGINQQAQERFWSFAPSGEPLSANPQFMFIEVFEGFTNTVTLTSGGKLSAIYSGFDGFTHNSGLLPNGKASGADETTTLPAYNPWAADEAGHLYFPSGPTLERFSENLADEGETGLPAGEYLNVDPSSNDLYSRTRGKIEGVHYSDPLVKATPFSLIEGIYAGGGGFAFDATGEDLYAGEGQKIGVYRREAASAPTPGAVVVGGIRSSRAELRSTVVANGAEATYHYEYGTTTAYGSRTPDVKVPFSLFPSPLGPDAIEGLAPDTTYHVRIVVTNAAGTTYGADRYFTTYAIPPGGFDPCPNALARKATQARALPDCRAFELVSAADTGGYDVESSLSPGQEPFPGYPDALDRVLYATHSGAVPGPWKATNKGPDPYLAERGPEGWRTRYLGLPSDLNPAAGSFSSVLGEADPRLDTLAFAGPGLCSPCFPGANPETGIPVRLSNGALVQGMAGSLDPGIPGALPEGKVAQMFSGDGHQLVFASKYAFEPGAASGGDLTVYERDLGAGTTRIVSIDQAGATLTGPGISELAISADGSRVLVGKRVSVDSAGNEYVHPYLYIAGRAGSVDLDPGGTAGVLIAGMSEDGSKVFFTTTDKLLPADQDPSADLYEAAADPSGLPTISLLSGGEAASCNPVANSARTHWNSVGAAANCDVLAVGGGGGASASGKAIYFLSPEQLDGAAGTPNQPNLYRVAQGGEPRFIATLEADNPLVIDSMSEAAIRRSGDFETTADGGFAVFRSALELTGVHTFGFLDVFEYAAATDRLACASCDTTNTSESKLLSANAELAPDGLSLVEDGRVFFSTQAALVLNDANGRRDVYSWSGGLPQLISSGIGAFDSRLLTVTATGKDAFFFTRDNLVPEEDHNGSLVRIYDAREEGGFFRLPGDVQCKASDECHGPGTTQPPAPAIASSGATTNGNYIVCKKGQVKRAGKCVKKPGKKKHQPKKHKAQKKQGKGRRHA